MKKIAKIILAISLLIFTSFTICNNTFAENITEQTSTEQNTNQTFTEQMSNQSSGQITTTVSSTTSADEGFLSVTNIINILLIAVGIVIIFLAIAILTRLKF